MEAFHYLNLKEFGSKSKDFFNSVGKLLDFVGDILSVDVESLFQMKIDSLL